jgi:hypothetical protein
MTRSITDAEKKAIADAQQNMRPYTDPRMVARKLPAKMTDRERELLEEEERENRHKLDLGYGSRRVLPTEGAE